MIIKKPKSLDSTPSKQSETRKSSNSTALYTPAVLDIDDVIRRMNGQKFVHEHKIFYMYMRKPVQNKLLLRIGYCFDLAACAVITLYEPETIYVFSQISPVRATTLDLLPAQVISRITQRKAIAVNNKHEFLMKDANKLFKSLFHGMGAYQEFPTKYGEVVSYTAFASEMQLVFVETDDSL